AVAVDEVELARERREDERERGRVVGADRARGLLEEADHGVIWLPRFRSRSARDPGGARHRADVAELACELGRVDRGAARAVVVARRQAGGREAEQEIEPRARVDRRALRRLDRAAVVLGRLLVPEPPEREVAGARRVR